MMCRLLALLVSLFVSSHAHGIDTNGPANHGEEITVDLPASLHQANISVNGLGCCVFRSLDHAARYQNVPALINFPEWMRDNRISGGGWPEKVDQLIPRICKDRGFPIPLYVQHTGGDTDFLRVALRTNRMVCVTYNGRDDFYSGTIAHMVNLVHLSDKWAAVADNNRPGKITWMTVPEFESRWKGSGGGWAIVLLASPPTPIPINSTRLEEYKMNSLLLATMLLAPGGWGTSDCQVATPVRSVENHAAHGWYDAKDGKAELWWKGEKIGTLDLMTADWHTHGKDKSVDLRTAFNIAVAKTAPSPKPHKDCVCKLGKCECNKCPNDCVGNPKGCICKQGECKCDKCPEGCVAEEQVVQVGNDPFPGGVATDKIGGSPEYIYRGKPCTKLQAYQAIGGGLIDDRNKPTLTIVEKDQATINKILADLDNHPSLSPFKGKMHINAYTPDHWVVQQVGLAPGISFQGTPDDLGKAKVLWRFRAYAGPEALAEAIRKADPNYKAEKDPDPMVKPEPPKPAPAPVDPVKPDNQPAPFSGTGLLAFLAAIFVLIFVAVKR